MSRATCRCTTAGNVEIDREKLALGVSPSRSKAALANAMLAPDIEHLHATNQYG